MKGIRSLSPLFHPPEGTFIIPCPPSALTREDWVRMYGESTLAWWALTPQERMRQAAVRFAAYLATRTDLDDGLNEDGTLHVVVSTRPL